MKLTKLFTFTMAALALGACSNDDNLTDGTNPDNGGKTGELIEAITIAFPRSVGTRADAGTIQGEGTEDNVYVAYVFARENDPQHEGKKVGDWTVKRVKDASVTDATEDNDIATPIKSGTVADAGTKGNMCTFNGVQQGDSVYVIANDPTMDMATATKLAHQGSASEASIRAYVSTLPKSYLNKMAVASDKDQKQHFIMTGGAAIPTNPNTPNGGTVVVPVQLDRELAKVYFDASVSTDVNDEATGKIEIKDGTTPGEGDGIIITRISKRISPFTLQARDWYFPLSVDKTAKDWDAENWLKAFNGDGETALGTAESDEAKAFNNNLYQSTAKEYRLTWQVTDKADVTPATSKAYIKGGVMYSPFFYVTPNYSNHSGCNTAIVTQATYKGTNTLLEETITDAMVAEAIENEAFKTTTGLTKLEDITAETWNDAKNVTALVTFLDTKPDYASVFRGATEQAAKEAAITIKTGDKRYYRADVANMTDDNATSLKLTERNTFYRITGTIATLGAKSIEDAINSDDISMIVQVEVKKWNYVINNIKM